MKRHFVVEVEEHTEVSEVGTTYVATAFLFAADAWVEAKGATLSTGACASRRRHDAVSYALTELAELVSRSGLGARE